MPKDELKLLIHARTPQEEAARQADAPPKPLRARRKLRIKTRLSFQERLLRNSALACAVLLGILAVGNIRQPWAENAAQGIERALTMQIDLDESLGQLNFVRNLMPESALVFFNISAGHEFSMPVDGKLTHAYSQAQPWLIFECLAESPIRAIADGTIAAVSTLSDGTIGVLIDHGNGMESVCASLDSCALASGDSVKRGQEIGYYTSPLYLELRQNGEAIDPSERMGL